MDADLNDGEIQVEAFKVKPVDPLLIDDSKVRFVLIEPSYCAVELVSMPCLCVCRVQSAPSAELYGAGTLALAEHLAALGRGEPVQTTITLSSASDDAKTGTCQTLTPFPHIIKTHRNTC
jgi:hypothetical protein